MKKALDGNTNLRLETILIMVEFSALQLGCIIEYIG